VKRRQQGATNNTSGKNSVGGKKNRHRASKPVEVSLQDGRTKLGLVEKKKKAPVNFTKDMPKKKKNDFSQGH